MPDTIATNPILTTPFVTITQPVTISHSDKETTECFVVDPKDLSLKQGLFLKFSAESKFKIDLTDNKHEFSKDIFIIDSQESVIVEVIKEDESSLTIWAICDICSQANNIEARKKMVIKNVGETIDSVLSNKTVEILQDIEHIKSKIVRLSKKE